MNDHYSHGGLFNYRYVLIPICITKRYRFAAGKEYRYSVLYIFGIRIAYWSN